MREPLLKMQVESQRNSYAAQFPRADHSIILLDDAPVGRLIVDRAPDVHYLINIVVAASHRGQGIGSRALQALCAEADLARKPLQLQVQSGNRAKNLYSRHGFRIVDDLEIAWLMERAAAV